MTIDTHAVLQFFAIGKNRENAREALQLLEESIGQGFWVKAASRKVRAALTKPKVAKKHGKVLDGVYRGPLCSIRWALTYSRFESPEALGAMATDHGSNPGLSLALSLEQILEVVEFYFRFVAAMCPVMDAMLQLDNTRPAPVFTHLGASPTVTATVESFGATAVEVCEMEYERVERKNSEGRIAHVTVVNLLWPDGTQHHTSRHAGDSKCEACGHGIRNPYNWVPLVLTTPKGPKSLWVGRDCAKTLFGIELTGDLEITDKA